MTASRLTVTLSDDWRFHAGEIADRNHNQAHGGVSNSYWLKAGTHGVSQADYPDGGWATVRVPHDFVLATPFSREASENHGSHSGGIAWYRRKFELLPEDSSRRILLEFDGIFRDSEVWCNGHFIKRHLSGYTGFQVDVTEVCVFGGVNAIAVRVDATLHELWSYEGGGIYREVRLIKANALHVDHCGVFVNAKPSAEVAPGKADVNIETTLLNAGRDAAACEVVSEIVSAAGKVIAAQRVRATVEAYGRQSVRQRAALPEPELWGIEKPYLYRLRTTIMRDGKPADAVETPFGVRSIRFDAAKGFFLNGKSMKLKGVCNHQDHAGVGVAMPPRLDAWRVERLKEMGCNALRTSHNPPNPALLDACDRLGLLVMAENRLLGVSSENLGQLESMIRRDRNHPSVILWSLGNEEMAIHGTEQGVRVMRRMQDLAHRLDPSRPVTCAINCWVEDVADLQDKSGFRLDVFGANYWIAKGRKGARTDIGIADRFHAKYPDWPLVGSESGGSHSTRGLYDWERAEGPLELVPGTVFANPKRKGFVSAYGETFSPWGDTIEQTWKDCAARPFVAGVFLWTGFDYRGEVFPCHWPAVITRYGIMDLCGFPKDAYWYYRAWWREDETVLHVFPHWNWAGKEGVPIDVWCYSNCAAVELFLNGKTLGRKTMEPNGHLEWAVPYEPGVIEAKGFNAAGRQIAAKKIETAGEPHRIVIEADRREMAADGADVIVVNAAVEDAQGRPVPTADCLLYFRADGAAALLGSGNGNPLSHEDERSAKRTLYHGRCQWIMQSKKEAGPIKVTVSAHGLRPASLSVTAVPPEGAKGGAGRKARRRGRTGASAVRRLAKRG